MKDFIYWFRWIVFLPAAFIVGGLVNLLILGVFVLFGIVWGSIDVFLFPFTMSLVFILTSYRIVPSQKIKTITIVFIVFVIWNLVSIFISLPDDRLVELISPNQNGIFRATISVLGIFTGLYLIKKRNTNL